MGLPHSQKLGVAWVTLFLEDRVLEVLTCQPLNWTVSWLLPENQIPKSFFFSSQYINPPFIQSLKTYLYLYHLIHGFNLQVCRHCSPNFSICFPLLSHDLMACVYIYMHDAAVWNVVLTSIWAPLLSILPITILRLATRVLSLSTKLMKPSSNSRRKTRSSPSLRPSITGGSKGRGPRSCARAVAISWATSMMMAHHWPTVLGSSTWAPARWFQGPPGIDSRPRGSR